MKNKTHEEIAVQKALRETEKKLKQTESYFKALIEKAPDGIALISGNGAFKYISPNSFSMFGFDPEEMGIMSPNELTHPDDRAEVIDVLTGLIMDPSRMPTIQYRFRHKNGSWIWIESTFRNLLADPSVEAIIINFRDIAERKAAEIQFREMNQELDKRVKLRTTELEEVNKELETFSYSISHDLRAPLRRIRGFIDLFNQNKSSFLSNEEQEYLHYISDSAMEMEKLIEAILSFSRLNRNELQKTMIHTSSMVQQVISLFDMETSNRNIKFNITFLPEITGDEELIRQVWTNLISNAIKYTSKKTEALIDIGSFSSDNFTTFFVKDNGAGFNMKYAEKLFGVFQRLHKQSDFEGIGIGLANVNRIIVRHGGRCRAEGIPDHGATFYFSLPM